jgi:hypothetical protein
MWKLQKKKHLRDSDLKHGQIKPNMITLASCTEPRRPRFANIHSSMSSSLPTLPSELEREIFEICAVSRPVCIPKLVLVAQRVKEWFVAICAAENSLTFFWL